jgi:hypothetical protein
VNISAPRCAPARRGEHGAQVTSPPSRPFETEAEAEKNAERVALGGAKVKDSGQIIHAAPEKKQ